MPRSFLAELSQSLGSTQRRACSLGDCGPSANRVSVQFAAVTLPIMQAQRLVRASAALPPASEAGRRWASCRRRVLSGGPRPAPAADSLRLRQKRRTLQQKAALHILPAARGDGSSNAPAAAAARPEESAREPVLKASAASSTSTLINVGCSCKKRFFFVEAVSVAPALHLRLYLGAGNDAVVPRETAGGGWGRGALHALRLQ